MPIGPLTYAADPVLIDSRKIPDAAVVEADLCIVGAGAAGIAIAREWMLNSTWEGI